MLILKSNKYFVITKYDCEPDTFAEKRVILNHNQSVSSWRKRIEPEIILVRKTNKIKGKGGRGRGIANPKKCTLG